MMPSGAISLAPPPEAARANRFLANLPLSAYAPLARHLRTVELRRGTVLHDVGAPIDHVYFPHSGMVSIVTIMRDGASVETATVGRAGVIGVTAAFGGRRALGRAVVQLPGTASRISDAHLEAAAQESRAIRDLAVRYNDF